MSVQVKICGLCRPEDARAASEAGADYLGIVFAPSPRRRSAVEAHAIWDGTAGRRAGVFVDARESDVLEIASQLDLHVVQLHGSESPDECQRLRESGVREVWKALRVGRGSGLAERIERYAAAVDAVLLDGWSRKGRGGVGARFDWSAVSEARACWPEGVRLVAAGGLNPYNVRVAIEKLRPHVVDVSSGVESRLGTKDGRAVRAFIEAARGGEAKL